MTWGHYYWYGKINFKLFARKAGVSLDTSILSPNLMGVIIGNSSHKAGDFLRT